MFNVKSGSGSATGSPLKAADGITLPCSTYLCTWPPSCASGGPTVMLITTVLWKQIHGTGLQSTHRLAEGRHDVSTQVDVLEHALQLRCELAPALCL